MVSARSVFFLCLILISCITFGQSGRVVGRISDQGNNPVAGVLIFINYNYLDYTDSQGNYRIENIPFGKYLVKVSNPGYKSITDTIIIGSGISSRNFRISSSPLELDEIVVTTDRMGNYLRNSAYSEIIVGSNQLQEKPFYSLPDALKKESGISLIRDGIWGTEVNIRGLSRENIVTLIDGIRIVTSTDIAARFSLIDMNDVERIEVIKGASSSVYGSGATGGIVNVITKTPSFSEKYYFDGSVSAGFNSVNKSSVTSGLFYSGSRFWSAKISAAYRNAGNINTPAGRLQNSQFEDYSLSGAINLKTFEDQKLRLDYQQFKATDVGIPGSSVFPGNATVRYPDEKREMISAGYEILNISNLLYKLSAKYAYQYIERNVENIPNIVQNIPADGSNPAKRISILKITPGAEHISNNFDIQGNMMLAENNHMIFGIDYWDRSYSGHREKYQMTEILDASGNVAAVSNKITGEDPLPVSSSENVGIYLQDEARFFNDKLTLSIGARTDKIFINGKQTFNPVYEIVDGVRNETPAGQKVIWNDIKTDDASYSSNIGGRYSLLSCLDITLSLGLSYRSPSLEERFQYIDQGSYIKLGNPDLKSEKGKSADLGIRLYIPDLKIIVSIFYNYFTDLVTEEAGIFEGGQAFIKTNVGKARLYGFDSELEYNFYDNFIFYSVVSYVKGDDLKLNKHLPAVPPLKGQLGFKMKFADKLEADLSSDIYARQNYTASGEMETPGYAVLNLSAGSAPVKLSNLSFQIYCGAENIFNKSYRNHLSTIRGSLVLEPGRNYYVKLVIKW